MALRDGKDESNSESVQASMFRDLTGSMTIHEAHTSV